MSMTWDPADPAPFDRAVPPPAETAEVHQEDLLDEALQETFPASDPVSVVRIT
jgi:hypothetical protein